MECGWFNSNKGLFFVCGISGKELAEEISAFSDASSSPLLLYTDVSSAYCVVRREHLARHQIRSKTASSKTKDPSHLERV